MAKPNFLKRSLKEILILGFSLEPQTTNLNWMEMVISNHFLYKDLESSNWNNHFKMVWYLGVRGLQNCGTWLYLVLYHICLRHPHVSMRSTIHPVSSPPCFDPHFVKPWQWSLLETKHVNFSIRTTALYNISGIPSCCLSPILTYHVSQDFEF